MILETEDCLTPSVSARCSCVRESAALSSSRAISASNSRVLTRARSCDSGDIVRFTNSENFFAIYLPSPATDTTFCQSRILILFVVTFLTPPSAHRRRDRRPGHFLHTTDHLPFCLPQSRAAQLVADQMHKVCDTAFLDVGSEARAYSHASMWRLPRSMGTATSGPVLRAIRLRS